MEAYKFKNYRIFFLFACGTFNHHSGPLNALILCVKWEFCYVKLCLYHTFYPNDLSANGLK